ncbi:PleD family two-component system response regulator [Pedobacter aquatilis]|uniref:response regulator n=1 Tax=Pedobacter aquatilis TaxID=351343 RepID=UPI00292F2767|nr:response regulator [Pedobacter aquatilis]
MRIYFYIYLSQSKTSSIKKKILFIDDEPTLLEIAPLLFEDYQVLTTSDAAAVLELIASFEPDVVMIDIIMGIIDGNTLCRQIKTHPRFSTLPVVLMTAGFLQQKDKLSGADGYIEKPFDIVSTLSLIELLTAG